MYTFEYILKLIIAIGVSLQTLEPMSTNEYTHTFVDMKIANHITIIDSLKFSPLCSIELSVS